MVGLCGGWLRYHVSPWAGPICCGMMGPTSQVARVVMQRWGEFSGRVRSAWWSGTGGRDRNAWWIDTVTRCMRYAMLMIEAGWKITARVVPQIIGSCGGATPMRKNYGGATPVRWRVTSAGWFVVATASRVEIGHVNRVRVGSTVRRNFQLACMVHVMLLIVTGSMLRSTH